MRVPHESRAYWTRLDAQQAAALTARVLREWGLWCVFEISQRYTLSRAGVAQTGGGKPPRIVIYPLGLQVGTVLHECAHVITHALYAPAPIRSHGREFQEVFYLLLERWHEGLI